MMHSELVAKEGSVNFTAASAPYTVAHTRTLRSQYQLPYQLLGTLPTPMLLLLLLLPPSGAHCAALRRPQLPGSGPGHGAQRSGGGAGGYWRGAGAGGRWVAVQGLTGV